MVTCERCQQEAALREPDVAMMAMEVEVFDLVTLARVCKGMALISLAGASLLAPLALVLYLISWWAVCPK